MSRTPREALHNKRREVHAAGRAPGDVDLSLPYILRRSNRAA